MTIDQTLAERGSRYGEFTDHADITQGIKEAMSMGNNWETLDNDQRECLEMVAHKIGRILNGDADYIDSWTDIIGYTRLVEKRLITEQAQDKSTCQTAFDKAMKDLVGKKMSAVDPKIAAALQTLVDAGVVTVIDGDS
jgi:hypothetical protein